MADYYSVLSRAVAHLHPDVETARRGLYERARKAVRERMRTIDASEDDIGTELEMFNQAVARIEHDIAGPVEAALRARPLRPRRDAIPRPPVEDKGPERPPADQSADRKGTPRPALSRRMIASAAAVATGAAIAALGYGYFPRPGPNQAQGTNVAPVATSPRAATPEARRQAVETADAALPYMLARQLVYYRTTYPAGTIIVSKSQHFLYLVKDNEAALRYTIGVGPDCDATVGLLTIAAKQGGPEPAPAVISTAGDQSAPTPVRDGAAGIPTLALADSACRIRATNLASVIGKNPSSGGFQLMTDDMLDLYERVPVGAKVVVTN